MRDFVDEYYADKDLSLLKKLTLVIPTYNRNYYLSRCLWYHAHFPFGEIIVADSSPEEKKVVNRETIQKIREMFGAKIQYLEYEPETEKYGEDIYQKWGDAVQHVETEYSKICTDKEFVIPNNINNLIKFLDNNSDYAIADGNYISVISKNNCEDLKYFQWCPNDKTYDSNIPVKRITKMLENMEKDDSARINTLLSIYRSNTHKMIYLDMIKNSLNDIRFGDLVVPLISTIISKRHHTNTEYFIRDESYNQPKNKITPTQKSSSSRYPHLQEYVTEGIYFEKVSNMEILIKKTIKNQNISGISDRDVTDIVERYLKSIGFYYSEKDTLQKILYRSYILKRLWNCVPYHIRSNIYFARTIGKKRIKKDKNETILLNRKTELDQITEELKIIEKIIRYNYKDHFTDVQNNKHINKSD